LHSSGPDLVIPMRRAGCPFRVRHLAELLAEAGEG